MSYLHTEEFQDIAEELDLIKIDDFDDCCIGITEHSLQPQLVYSSALILNNLIGDDDMDPDEALDYFLYNIVGGLPDTPNAPVILQDY